ncbi:MAG: hypothetical protein M1548_01465 [Actinobacteria bacterium]|nr:hypothetical protein [Actinomycetota bacterium]
MANLEENEARLVEPVKANRRILQVVILSIIAITAALAIGYTVMRERAIPEAPDLSGEQKRAEAIVKEYEEAIRKKDAKKAWGVLAAATKNGSTLTIFEKGIKDFPAAFKRYEINSKSTDRLVNMSFGKDYRKLLNGDMMQGSWAVVTKYPDVPKNSEDSSKVFIVIPEKGGFKIYDIRPSSP